MTGSCRVGAALIGAFVLAMACASRSSAVKRADAEETCERASGPTDEPGRMWCMTTCARPRGAATCNGPRGRPVACTCTGGDREGETFALDRCDSLDGQTVLDRCGEG